MVQVNRNNLIGSTGISGSNRISQNNADDGNPKTIIQESTIRLYTKVNGDWVETVIEIDDGKDRIRTYWMTSDGNLHWRNPDED